MRKKQLKNRTETFYTKRGLSKSIIIGIVTLIAVLILVVLMFFSDQFVGEAYYDATTAVAGDAGVFIDDSGYVNVMAHFGDSEIVTVSFTLDIPAGLTYDHDTYCDPDATEETIFSVMDTEFGYVPNPATPGESDVQHYVIVREATCTASQITFEYGGILETPLTGEQTIAKIPFSGFTTTDVDFDLTMGDVYDLSANADPITLTISTDNVPVPAVVRSGGAPPPGDFTFTTTSFTDGGAIPNDYVPTDGIPFVSLMLVSTGTIPTFNIVNVPTGTQSLVLIMEDMSYLNGPDGTLGNTDDRPAVHWLISNIPPGTAVITDDLTGTGTVKILEIEGHELTGFTEISNDYDESAYVGPFPPDGENHQYRFTLYALDATPSISSADTFLADISSSIIESKELTGWYPAVPGAEPDCTDVDGDGYGASGTDLTECTGSTTDADCNDGDATINPGADEICDGLDNDCSESTADGVDEATLGDPCDGDDLDMCENGALECTDSSLVCRTETQIDISEVCDDTENADEDCDGLANCDDDDCDDDPACTAKVCGDDTIDTPNDADVTEICDGTDLGTETCETQGFHTGTLACSADCLSYDTDGCHNCGDGVDDPDEDCSNCSVDAGCDTGNSCEADAATGEYSCIADPTCGDSTEDPDETCLSCPADVPCGADEYCNTDTAACEPLCGNGVEDTGEDCNSCPEDITCQTGESCQGDTGVYTCVDSCGNGVIDTGEDCDSDNLNSQTCEDLPGFIDGTLTCNADCTFNTDVCNPVTFDPADKDAFLTAVEDAIIDLGTEPTIQNKIRFIARIGRELIE